MLNGQKSASKGGRVLRLYLGSNAEVNHRARELVQKLKPWYSINEIETKGIPHFSPSNQNGWGMPLPAVTVRDPEDRTMGDGGSYGLDSIDVLVNFELTRRCKSQ
jgi:hypothetical protein